MNHTGKFEYTKFEHRRESYRDSISKLKSMDLSFEELIEDFPRFAGHMTIGRYLTLYEMYKKASGIAGHIAEVGTYKGSSLLWFTKLVQIFEPESLTQVHGFDWFKGTGDDSVELKIEKGSYSYEYENLQYLIEAQTLQNNCFVHKLDVVNELEDFFKQNPHLYFKVVFLDAGFYDVVKKSLEILWPRLNPGGILILDQFGHELSPGEAMAVKEILPDAKIETINNSWMPNSFIIKK
jgi:predicted O-methyltransferase YrrM